MDGNQRVWAPHPVEGYQMGIIVDVGADTLSVESLETPGQVSSTALVYTHATMVPGLWIVPILHHVHCQSVCTAANI